MINTLTLNPAVDRILILDKIMANTTNRVKKSDTAVGGKGTHVSMNLRLLGEPNRAFGLAGGRAGRLIIESLACWGVETHFVHSSGYESRTNYLLIEEENNSCTIIAEKGEPPPEGNRVELVEKLKALIQPGDHLVLSGDISNYADPSIYGQILESLQIKDLKVSLDADGETLKQGLAWSPFLITPNLKEFSELIGRELNSEVEIVAAIEGLAEYGIGIIAVTLGRSGAVVKMPQGIYRSVPPEVDAANTIGCGDCFLAGLLHGLQGNLPAEEAIALATAVSAAAAQTHLSVGFDTGRAAVLLERTRVEKIR